jgi:hypothetical protein
VLNAIHVSNFTDWSYVQKPHLREAYQSACGGAIEAPLAKPGTKSCRELRIIRFSRDFLITPLQVDARL